VPDSLMTRRDVAEYLSVPIQTLARWAYIGSGPQFFHVGRHTRYRREDVEGWLEQQRRVDRA
jgi:excisionase family DNA binding protein